MSSPPSSPSDSESSSSRRMAPPPPRSMGRVNLAPGQILAVPAASRIRTSQASSADITQALQRARGPPLLAWCQANGPCHYCRRRNVDCVFEEPQEDSRRDLAVCEACRGRHEACLVARLWRSCCVAAEQGWGLDWVWDRAGKGGVRPPVVEVPGGGPTAVGTSVTPVSTPRSRRLDKGKRKAVSESEVPRHVRRRVAPPPPVFEGGPSGSNVFLPGLGRLLPSITIRQGPPEILRAEVRRLREEVEGLREEVQVARQERDEVARARDALVRDRDALFERGEVQDRELGRLRALLAQEQAVRPAGIPGFAAPSEQEVEELARGLRQSGELEVRRREWLLHEVAAARLEVLGWAREHRLLVDGLSSGVLYVEEELAGREVTPGLTQGVGRLSRLMGAHWHWAFVEAGSWMEAFVDGLQTPPSVEEMIQAARESLDSEFGPGGGQGELQEGREGGD
ncbi:hypothetical protein C0992_007607 [Termitomyces sp. T32_za158]|nr:hypothetical protein C0992_007607 [Termitomyces sp. T32_za158]